MAARVFEIARELGVNSKDILSKCRAEGLELKNHMTTLSAGQEATIREWFSEEQSGTAVETTEHVDLTEVRAKARRTRRKAAVAPAEPVIEAPSEQVQQVQTVETAAQLPQLQEVVSEAPSQPVEAEQQAQPVGRITDLTSADAAQLQEQVKTEQEHPEKARIPKPPAVEEPPKAPVKPAGPQVVPRPATLRGPRVVRVERPDRVSKPTIRPPARPAVTDNIPPAYPTGRGGRLVAPSDIEADGAPKKGKQRTTRHRGDSLLDTGERIREWRDKDLAERSQRLAAATGGTLRRHRASVTKRSADQFAIPQRTGPIEITEPITVKDLSAASGIKAGVILKKLMEHQVLATVNQIITPEQVEIVMLEFGIALVVSKSKTLEQRVIEQFANRPKGKTSLRAPVATFLGHVDHGKTSLLDRIRHAAVASGEAGGITQHIGAYRYDRDGKQIVFLDTPGHEAFTAMRARGANMTDVVVLVVAADDGVMPQTVEAVNHAKAAGVPIIVSLNKIDAPNANITRALGQLAELGLQPRQWGGTTEVINTSAVTGEGIDNLLETLALEAELLELKAETDAQASGFVIEANMNPSQGALARLLVLNGTLRVGDYMLAGRSYGRVRSMTDDHGRSIQQAGPSCPVEISGLNEVPEAGDKFYVLESIEQARLAALERRSQSRQQALSTAPRTTMDNLLERISAGQTNQLAMVVKADVQGSLEAIQQSLKKLATDEIGVNILHSAVGGISTGDVMLADASGAIILGFNVVPSSGVRFLAEQKGVDIRLYRIIYDMIDDVRKALSEGLAPEVRQEVLGHAAVRQTFKVSRLGTVAGCFVTDGSISRSVKVRIIRNDIVIEDERSLESLRRFKDDVRDVRNGMECGLKIAGYDDIKEGDVLEFYRQVEVARTL